VLHEDLQADIVGEDSRAGSSSVIAAHVRCRGIQLGEQETGLRASSVANNISRNGESVGDQFLKDRRYRSAGRQFAFEEVNVRLHRPLAFQSAP
jgi:hypothetical protein